MPPTISTSIAFILHLLLVMQSLLQVQALPQLRRRFDNPGLNNLKIGPGPGRITLAPMASPKAPSIDDIAAVIDIIKHASSYRFVTAFKTILSELQNGHPRCGDEEVELDWFRSRVKKSYDELRPHSNRLLSSIIETPWSINKPNREET